MFGSDHKTLKAIINNKSIVIERDEQRDKSPRESPMKVDRMVDEDNTESDVKDNEKMEWALNLV
jgi:hypothetical protein